MLILKSEIQGLLEFGIMVILYVKYYLKNLVREIGHLFECVLCVFVMDRKKKNFI